ncbi:hypothetical protein OH77DRAFT_1428463 [Trametes cingulata]|nr:hypothetical protein OH77DRAFT_1428463 [Trametes cingulata]
MWTSCAAGKFARSRASKRSVSAIQILPASWLCARTPLPGMVPTRATDSARVGRAAVPNRLGRPLRRREYP